LSQSHIKREESLQRQAWLQYRSWSRITSGVWLSVIGAVQYGPTKVFYKVVPQFDTEAFRQYIHQVMALFGHSGKEVVMVADRSGIHRAKKLASTLAHWHERFRLHVLPAPCGHHLHPMEGFWWVRNTTWRVIALYGEIEEDRSRRRETETKEAIHVADHRGARDDPPRAGPLSPTVLPR
jgi:uncharacterized protein (DUF1684 family)